MVPPPQGGAPLYTLMGDQTHLLQGRGLVTSPVMSQVDLLLD